MSPTAASTRWCPTPEQLMILEEMYRGGIKTPTALQIQQITAHLSFYGKIEGKNVFYWFQNHKARDRQKLRRKLCEQLHQQRKLSQRSNYRLFLDPLVSFGPQQLFTNCTPFPQNRRGGVEDAQRAQLMSYRRITEVPERHGMENNMMRIYGNDWMVMAGVGPCSPPPMVKPLETLQLFPITATNVKEEPAPSKDLSCSSACK